MPEQLDAQTIFDTVARHLHRQGRPAKKGDMCAYRGSNGTSCAVGCLITDAEYRPYMDDEDDLKSVAADNQVSPTWISGTSVNALAEAGVLPERLRPHVDLLSELQNSHDDWEPEDEVDQYAFKSIANDLGERAARRGLSTKVIDDLVGAS